MAQQGPQHPRIRPARPARADHSIAPPPGHRIALRIVIAYGEGARHRGLALLDGLACWPGLPRVASWLLFIGAARASPTCAYSHNLQGTGHASAHAQSRDT